MHIIMMKILTEKEPFGSNLHHFDFEQAALSAIMQMFLVVLNIIVFWSLRFCLSTSNDTGRSREHVCPSLSWVNDPISPNSRRIVVWRIYGKI